MCWPSWLRGTWGPSTVAALTKSLKQSELRLTLDRIDGTSVLVRSPRITAHRRAFTTLAAAMGVAAIGMFIAFVVLVDLASAWVGGVLLVGACGLWLTASVVAAHVMPDDQGRRLSTLVNSARSPLRMAITTTATVTCLASIALALYCLVNDLVGLQPAAIAAGLLAIALYFSGVLVTSDLVLVSHLPRQGPRRVSRTQWVYLLSVLTSIGWAYITARAVLNEQLVPLAVLIGLATTMIVRFEARRRALESRAQALALTATKIASLSDEALSGRDGSHLPSRVVDRSTSARLHSLLLELDNDLSGVAGISTAPTQARGTEGVILEFTRYCAWRYSGTSSQSAARREPRAHSVLKSRSDRDLLRLVLELALLTRDQVLSFRSRVVR